MGTAYDQTDARTPDHHRRCSERNDRRSAAWRRQGVARMGDGVHPVYQVSAQASGDCRGCGLPLPRYFLADEKHRHCLTDKVYLPTIVCGRVIWPLGYTEDASAAAFTESLGRFNVQHSSRRRDPGSKGPSSMASTVPARACGRCFQRRLSCASATRSPSSPGQLTALASPVRKALRSPFHLVVPGATVERLAEVFALGQRLPRFADHITTTAGSAGRARPACQSAWCSSGRWTITHRRMGTQSCQILPSEAFDEQGHTLPPRNPMECGIFRPLYRPGNSCSQGLIPSSP